MRRLAIVLATLAALGGVAWAAAVPGGHEAFLYWFNGTKWTPTTAGDPIPVTDVAEGAIEDAAATVGGAGTISAKLRLMTTQLSTLGTNTGSCVGATSYHLANGSAATTNSTSMRNAAANLCTLRPLNTTTTIYYLKLYNTASAPTCSSATGLVHVYPVPPAGASGGVGGLSLVEPGGEAYSSGIGYCLVSSGADTSNAAAATGVYIEASYK